MDGRGGFLRHEADNTLRLRWTADADDALLRHSRYSDIRWSQYDLVLGTERAEQVSGTSVALMFAVRSVVTEEP